MESLSEITQETEAELFEWPLPLLSAMKKTTKAKSPNLLYRVGDILDRLGEESDDNKLACKEIFQYANPLTKPLLKKIKRITGQPNMTADDRKQLRHYRENYHKVPDKSLPKLSVENGVYLFKLLLVDQEAADFKTKYSVEYASNSVSYEEVIAITYAWHESDNKTSIELDRKTIQLGDEWDVDAVLDTLAELSDENWIWMDQFSLNQDDVKTATLSYTIPMIFRNVRVVAFLPYTVCDRLFTRTKVFREEESPNASFALGQVMLHDLACECTDGIYGWLSRLWPWQELMLASSLRFVWGLGESKWTRREFLNEPEKHKDEKQPPGKDCSISRAWTRAKQEGRKIKKSVNRSITDLSTFEQPIMKLLKELTKRNTESVIISKEESASLSMVHYFCMRLLSGAEVYMPSPSQIEPIKCLKVLQELASTGRKGGRRYDCYYAAAAFINDSTFLPEKKSRWPHKSTKMSATTWWTN